MFRFVDTVVFHVGAMLISEAGISYYGEPGNQNVIYKNDHADWLRLQQDS